MALARSVRCNPSMMIRTLAVILSLTSLSACAPGQVGAGSDESSTADALRSCAHGAKVAGVDVSYFQGTINWGAVADTSRGNKSFAFIRANDGYTHDTKFAANWQGAYDAGLYRGAYTFFRASDDPTQQAEALLNSIGWELGDQDLPPVLDLEVKDGMSAATVAKRAEVWLSYVYGVLGRRPIVYTGAGFEDLIGNPGALGDYPLWVANWTSSCPQMPAAWSAWEFWQNRVASKGTVSGISASIDLDYFNGDADALAAYAGPHGG
ncbi:MAG: GH25 family lysozyme [Polyangia bacterium]